MKKTNILKKAILVSAVTVPFLAYNVNAESYIANDWEIYKTRTKEQIIAEYNKTKNTGSYENGNSETYYKVAPITSAPYNEGELTADTHKAMTTMANYYRWLVGVEPLTGVSTHRKDLQAGALVRISIDNFTHFLDDSQRPRGMSDELWQIAKMPPHNIIAWGYTPTGAITGWLNEGYNLTEKTFDTTGHRRAILDPDISLLQFGYVAPTAMGNIVETKNTSDLAYTAFPVPGYMPNNILNDNTSAWNITLNTAKLNYDDPSKIIVRVTDLQTNKSYECKKEDNTLQVSGGELIFVQPSVENTQYLDNTSYKVEVLGLQESSNIREVSAPDAKVEYTVNFFDVTKSNEQNNITNNNDNSVNNNQTNNNETNNTQTNNSETNNNETSNNQTNNSEMNNTPSQNTTTNTDNNANQNTTTENNETNINKDDQTVDNLTTNVSNNDVGEENPQTGDNIILNIGLLVITLFGLIFGLKSLNRKSAK